MTLDQLRLKLNELHKLKHKGGKAYKEAQKLLNKDATTHNIKELQCK